MNPEKGDKLVTVIFPEVGAEIKARLINARDIKNGGTYLVDREHNAHVILEPISDQPLPKGGWKIKEPKGSK